MDNELKENNRREQNIINEKQARRDSKKRLYITYSGYNNIYDEVSFYGTIEEAIEAIEDCYRVIINDTNFNKNNFLYQGTTIDTVELDTNLIETYLKRFGMSYKAFYRDANFNDVKTVKDLIHLK